MNESEDSIVVVFKERILAGLVAQLAVVAEELGKRPIEHFIMVMNAMIGEALHDLVDIAPGRRLENLSDEARSFICGKIVSDLNSALALDHRYAIGLVVLTEDKEVGFARFNRRILPGLHDLLNRAFLPIFRVKSREDFQNSPFKIADVQFLGPDDPDIKPPN